MSTRYSVPVAPHPRAVEVAGLVDTERLWQRHMRLAEHGATAKGGVDRQALSPEDVAARATLRGWADGHGMEASVDPIANLFLRWPGGEAGAAPILTGSHLDSQPTGGRFDGVYGVLAGLEAVAAFAAAGVAPPRPIEVVAWTNEEGSRFAPGMMGSAAFAGRRALAELLPIADGAGVTLAAALQEVLAVERDVRRRPLGFPVAAYVEAHIEQGPVLERLGAPTGVVTGIQGKRTFRVVVTGEEAHAGTTPLLERKDALSAAVRVIAALEDAMGAGGDDVKFTVGRLNVSPNAPSVVPGRVEFSIDLRHLDGAALSMLGDRVPAVCEANKGRCAVVVEELSRDASLEFPAAMRDLVRATAGALSLPTIDIHSAAGHDARHLHAVCPAGMIFVPCHKGISHNEAERATPADLAAGARLLTAVLLALADA